MLNVFKVISGQIIWKQILSVYFFRHFLCREAYRPIVLGSFGALCWVFRVQGFHNRHCEWTDALVVRPGLRVCFALMALTHGPTYSLKICFFNWRSLVLTSGWTHFSGFPPVFSFFYIGWFCFMESVRLCKKCQESLVFAEIISGFLFFFCIHVGEAQADWFVVLLLCSVLHFLSVHEPDQTVSYICLC